MVYLSCFEFPDREVEYSFTMSQKRTCYDTFYPFLVLSGHQFRRIDFEPVTSDDVFDFMLNLRSINDGINRKREDLFEDYLDTKYSHFQMKSLADYEY